MLQSFRFANHRSFADEQQLNLTPAYTQPESRVTVPVVGIFGANASGKSNALDALSSMRRLVLQSDKAVEPGLPSSLTREPFLLDPEIAVSPSRYVVDLSLDGVRHTYGYTIDDERIVEEWLYHYPFKKKRRVFERDGDSFAWGEETRKGSDLERISAITAPAALFVSTAARFAQAQSGGGHQPLHDVYKWFMRAITRDRPGLNAGNLLSLGSRWAAETNERRASIIELLKAADVGIVDVLLLEEPAHDGLGALVGRDPIGAPLV
ncbi:AAA family ATPase, partial [Actinoplanes sp. RD1]|uniref:AAA family ATPase n=1 Tax=Actinoplanes sp. RD1 TaxID=3064538 RepID=UPI0027408C4B